MARQGLSGDRLAKAGFELADDIGFENVTITELARRFDVKPASLYSHLRGCDDLKARIAVLALEELDGRVSDASAGRAGKAALRGVADAYRDYAAAHPGRFAAAQHPLDAPTSSSSAGARQSQRLRAILRAYPLAESEQVHAIRMLGSTIRGFVALELSGSFTHSSPGAEESWDRTIDALDVLLNHWPTIDPEETQP